MSVTRDTRPVDPEDREYRDRLNRLAVALRHVHSALLEEVKSDYERQHGRVGGPFVLFRLVTQDPFFAWLRPLSGEMALIDERIDDRTRLVRADLAGIRAVVEALFTSDAATPEGFAANYTGRLQTSAVVAMRHQAFREALEQLPREEDLPEGAAPGDAAGEEGGAS